MKLYDKKHQTENGKVQNNLTKTGKTHEHSNAMFTFYEKLAKRNKCHRDILSKSEPKLGQQPQNEQ